jgi:four helix bundle protein
MHSFFDHRQLDVGRVSLEALVRGEKIAKELPRGYGCLADQMRRALASTYLNTTEAIARRGGDRKMRLRIAKAEANEAVAAVDALRALELVGAEAEEIASLMSRVCQMLTGLERKS